MEAEGDFSLFLWGTFRRLALFFDGIKTLASLKNRIFTKFSAAIFI
jgi:hypothetical protein